MIPLLIAGVAAIGGGIAHSKAKKTNEEANEILEYAKVLYEKEKEILLKAENDSKDAMVSLGKVKTYVLNTSVMQFLRGWERIKTVKFNESEAIFELKNFTIKEADVLDIREMLNIYENSVKSSAAGVAVGGLAAVAAGSLSVPVVAVFAAAPALLFSGLNANKKAKENYENALVVKYQSEEAVEKMKTTEVLYNAIAKRSEMFENLLAELNLMFSKCAYSLDKLTKKKYKYICKGKTENLFTENELKLLAITRSLAGAVKSVLDTPILSADGELSEEWDAHYNEIESNISSFETKVKAIEHTGTVVTKVPEQAYTENSNNGNSVREVIRNIFAILGTFICGGAFNYYYNNKNFGLSPNSILYTATIMTTCLLLLLKSNNRYFFFRLIRDAACLGLSVLATKWMLLVSKVLGPTSFKDDLIPGIISFLVLGLFASLSDKWKSNIISLLLKISTFVFFAEVAYLLAGTSVVKWPGFLSVSYFILAICIAFMNEASSSNSTKK